MLTTKTRKCKVCKTPYASYQSFVSWCSADCGSVLAERKLAKIKKAAELREKRQDRVKRESLKRRADWIAEAQTAFNTWVRTRDQLAGLCCISSGKSLDWSGNNVDAGHYRSRGSAPHLRFDERNCHSQTKQENRYASGNVVDYRIGLIARIGLEAVEALEADQTPRRYTVDELKAIKAKYQLLTKELKANQ